MSDSLKTRTIHGLSWSLIDWIGVKGVQFGIGVMLARLLLPEQFGLIGMLGIFIAVAQAFLDSGFGSALIQKQDADQVDMCSIFYFNIVVGVLVAGVLCAASPWIAAFYDEPLLMPLTCVLSVDIVINSFSLVQTMLMTKHIDFKTQAKIGTVSVLISGLVGVGMAVAGYGVWSLAFQAVTATVCRTSLLWVFNSWRPSLIFSMSALRGMFGFGSRMLASGLLNTFFDNVYLLVIGKLYSATELGYYTRASSIQQLPSQGLYGIVNRVAFPVFSAVQDDPERFKRGLKHAFQMLVLLNFPMMVGLALVARPMVLIVLTDKWAPCIHFLQLLCALGMMYPLHAINVNVLMALGRSDLFFRIEVLKKVLIALGLVVTCSWGIEAMIWGQIVVGVVSYLPNSYYTGILLKYSMREQLSDILPYFVASIAMGAAVYAIGLLAFPNNWALLTCQVAAGVVLYVALCGIFRFPAFREIVDILRSRLRSAKAV
jgi:teichuronic acid exporter